MRRVADLSSASLSSSHRRVVESLLADLRVEFGADLLAVWLYGSRARGEPPHPESDVDLLVVTRDGSDGDWRRAYRILYGLAERAGTSPVDFSLKVVSQAWIDDRRAIESFFIQEVDRDKLVLAGQP
jgi:predicted nucleotidyltransferase